MFCAILLCLFFNLITHTSLPNNFLSANYKAYYYNLEVEPQLTSNEINASTELYFITQSSGTSIALNLATQLAIDSIVFQNKPLEYTRNRDTIEVYFPITLHKNQHFKIKIYYHGKPKGSINPPWDGGFVWQKDHLNRPWIGVACERIGARSWWPCQDNWSAEPDSMKITVITPPSLMGISNGSYQSKVTKGGKVYTSWKVHYPINLYGISIGLGNYSHFSDTLIRQNGSKLSLDYYILDYNKKKAQKHFTQVPIILKKMEHYFGDYPFPKDGYTLVESPYWGMEHQSAIAYGNNYKNNFYDFDYIIVHESAHEWWGNSVTANDPGNMWIHEAFATYAESLLAEALYNKDTATEYLRKQRLKIDHHYPIAGPLGVYFQDHKGTDQYYKGSWMLHTIRKVVNNDSLWFTCLKSFQSTFKHKTVSREDIVIFFNQNLYLDLTSIFSQYLDFTSLPTIEYWYSSKQGIKQLEVKWLAEATNFAMPIEFTTGKTKHRVLANNDLYTSIELPDINQTVIFNTKDYLIKLKIP